MLTVTDILEYGNDVDNNIIIGAPKLNKSEIKFLGKNNVLYCEGGGNVKQFYPNIWWR